MNGHRFVLKIEDGCMSWRLICPDDDSCGPANVCPGCGRSLVEQEPEHEPCYDCRDRKFDPDGCWAQTWVMELMAEEVIHGTVEIEFPVNCQWNGDGIEAHVMGDPVAFKSEPARP